MKVYLPRAEEIDYKAKNVLFLNMRLDYTVFYCMFMGKTCIFTLSSSFFRPSSSSDSDPECLVAYEVILCVVNVAVNVSSASVTV